MDQNIEKKGWISIPPWIMLGAVAVLLPLFVFMTWKYVHRQKQNTTELMVEKGAALIRSFEAGTRTGMMGMNWGGLQVQRLLSETAKQPDIIYLMVTDPHGKILAHSDPHMIGQTYKTDLDLGRISRSERLSWRRVTGPEGKMVFEVYRQFHPLQPPRFKRRGKMMRMMNQDWCQSMTFSNGSRFSDRRIIFVGMDMAPVEAARKEDDRHMVFMALTMLLLGFAGFITLFLAQAYRSTRTSLSRVKAFSDHLVETMPIGLVALDGEGKILSVNRAAEAILGEKVSQLGALQATRVLPSELLAIMEDARDKGGPVEAEITCIMRDGSSIPLEVIATPLEIGQGLTGLVTLFRDLSEIKRLKEEVARTQRLASIGRLAAGVAHEIRNPLSSIKGFATYFKERYKHIPQDQKTADIMIQEVERLNRVISQLLEFARPTHVQKSNVDLISIIQDALKMVEDDAGKRDIRLEIRAPEQALATRLDPDRIKQVLLNLYLNAIEAMDEGGTLIVEVSRERPGGPIEIRVKDTGKGIPEKDLPHVFDPYFTTKPSGTGLGLAIAHKIVEAHGGEILVESQVGEGTTVTIQLPYVHNGSMGEQDNGT